MNRIDFVKKKLEYPIDANGVNESSNFMLYFKSYPIEYSVGTTFLIFHWVNDKKYSYLLHMNATWKDSSGFYPVNVWYNCEDNVAKYYTTKIKFEGTKLDINLPNIKSLSFSKTQRVSIRFSFNNYNSRIKSEQEYSIRQKQKEKQQKLDRENKLKESLSVNKDVLEFISERNAFVDKLNEEYQNVINSNYDFLEEIRLSELRIKTYEFAKSRRIPLRDYDLSIKEFDNKNEYRREFKGSPTFLFLNGGREVENLIKNKVLRRVKYESLEIDFDILGLSGGLFNKNNNC